MTVTNLELDNPVQYVEWAKMKADVAKRGGIIDNMSDSLYVSILKSSADKYAASLTGMGALRDSMAEDNVANAMFAVMKSDRGYQSVGSLVKSTVNPEHWAVLVEYVKREWPGGTFRSEVSALTSYNQMGVFVRILETCVRD